MKFGPANNFAHANVMAVNFQLYQVNSVDFILACALFWEGNQILLQEQYEVQCADSFGLSFLTDWSALIAFFLTIL